MIPKADRVFYLLVIVLIAIIIVSSIFIYKKKEWGKLRYLLIITIIALAIKFYPLLGLAAWATP
jgi:hypothetical protein